MDKQYSVQFFSAFVESIQRLCREYLEFDQVVEIGGYLSVEIDNFRKERYVLSEMLQCSGNLISESYCTKAFKTHRCCTTKNALQERHSNVSGCDFHTNKGKDQITNKHKRSYETSRLQTSELEEYGRMDLEDTISSADRKSCIGPSEEDNNLKDETNSNICRNQKTLYTEQPWTRGANSNNINNGQLSSEIRRTKRLLSVSNSSSVPSKKEKQQHEESPVSSSQQNNSFMNSNESLRINQSNTDVSRNLLSQASHTTEETIRLPLNTVVKDEPDNSDCMVVGSSEEDSSLLDSSDASFSLDHLQSNQERANTSDSQPVLHSDGETYQATDRSKYGPVSTIRKRKFYKSYHMDTLKLAIQAVCERKMSIPEASKIFNIPKGTLRDKLPLIGKTRGKTALTAAEESLLADYIIERGNRGEVVSKVDLIRQVSSILSGTGRESPLAINRPIYGWLTAFLKRNPNVPDCYVKRSR